MYNSSKDRIARILHDSFYEDLDMFDQKTVYRVDHAFKVKDEKFFRWLEEYVDSVERWYEGDAVGYDQDIVIKGLPRSKIISPHKEIPKVLYRGLNNLKSRPREGQSVVYLTDKVNPLSSWTEDLGVAEDFACTDDGIVLFARREDVLSSVVPVLWPGHFVPSHTETEREWTLYIKKPLKIFKWEVV